MKSMKLTGLRQMEMTEVHEPQIREDDEVKIRMLRVGVCGSDIHYYTTGRIGSQVVKYPYTVGHEGAGIVESVGRKVTRVKPGDPIAIEPAISCMECDQCLSGRFHTCRKIKFLGCPGQIEGCLQEYIIMPETNCIPLGAALTPDQGSISEPLSIGIYAVRKSLNMQGLNIGILGCGPIGLSVLLAAKAEGAEKIFVSDKLDERLRIAAQCGATETCNVAREDFVLKIKQQVPLLLDVVFECCGQQDAHDQAFELLKPGGKLMVIGIPEFDRWSIPADEARRKEICIQHVRRQVGCVDEALASMESGRIDVSPMVTHRFPFTKTKEAFDLVASYGDGVLKAMIDF